jgi:hypothetical protein
MPMASSRRLLELYLPPAEGMTLESAVMTTYRVDWTFLEEDLLAPALGVRSPVSRLRAFRSELERRLQGCEITVLYDLRAAERESRLSPQIDPIPIAGRKLHAKVSLLLWSAQTPDGVPKKHARLIVGSANLTRAGFRESYEVIAALDYGERATSPPRLFRDAVRLVREISAESCPPRLQAQLATLEQFADGLRAEEPDSDQPWRLVGALEVVPSLAEAWRQVGEGAPRALVIASPFWPEGDDPAEAIVELTRRFGQPGQIELICQAGTTAIGGELVPVLPAVLPHALKARVGCKVVVRAARWDIGIDAETPVDTGETTEDDVIAPEGRRLPEGRRALHAKVIAVRGARGSVLYVGSSNCTRRGLALGRGPDVVPRVANWEAGLIYQLPPKRSGVIDEVLRFAGPPIEVRLDRPLQTEAPERDPDPPAPTFLEEVVGAGTVLTVKFRASATVPEDLILLMPDQRDRERYWLLWHRKPGDDAGRSVRAPLDMCPVVDQALKEITGLSFDVRAMSSWLEVRWNGCTAVFPVRFDDKELLPPVPGSRRLTESELIDYFLFGREPWEAEDGRDGADDAGDSDRSDSEVDTRRILSYFVRRFVEAIPGIEADVERAWHSRPALSATLNGPTGVLALATEAVRGLREGPRHNEPRKTSIAVGFQLVEIVATLQRCSQRAPAGEARAILDGAVQRCQTLLAEVTTHHPELREPSFVRYRRSFTGE